jgi:hypothetical protein
LACFRRFAHNAVVELREFRTSIISANKCVPGTGSTSSRNSTSSVQTPCFFGKRESCRARISSGDRPTPPSRLPDGRFDQDGCRIGYLRWLRAPERRSATQADAEHVKAKTEMLQLKLAEKRGELVRQSDVDALIDELVGVTLTAMSSMPARCAPRGDLATRRCIERVIFEVRTEVANIAQRKADECGEPPLSEQG